MEIMDYVETIPPMGGPPFRDCGRTNPFASPAEIKGGISETRTGGSPLLLS